MTPQAKTKDFPCTVEGCTEVLHSPQGLGAHRRSKHGIKGATNNKPKKKRQPKAVEVLEMVWSNKDGRMVLLDGQNNLWFARKVEV